MFIKSSLAEQAEPFGHGKFLRNMADYLPSKVGA